MRPARRTAAVNRTGEAWAINRSGAKGLKISLVQISGPDSGRSSPETCVYLCREAPTQMSGWQEVKSARLLGNG